MTVVLERPTAQPPGPFAARPRRLAWGLRWLVTVTTATLLALLLLAPSIRIARMGLTLTGFAEESVGYRYFHTLRILYGNGERPWLPQGQAAGVVHMLVQVILTALGYPPDQLFPRIDLWVFIACAIPLVLAAGLFVWAVQPVESPIGRIAIASLLVALVFDRSSESGVHVLLPDYMTWAFTLAVITLGWCLRLGQRTTPTTMREVVGCAVFSGICFAFKPTFITFAVPVAVLLLARAPSHPARLLAIATLGVGSLLTWLLVVLVYYLGSVGPTLGYFRGLLAFGESAGALMSMDAYLADALSQNPPDAALLAFVLPALLAVSAVLLPRRLVSLALLAGSSLATAVAFRRFYTATFVELNAFMFASLAIWAVVVVTPGLRARRFGLPIRRPLTLARQGVLAVLAVFLAWHAQDRIESVIDVNMTAIQQTTVATRDLTALLAETPGRAVFLSPDNSRRPVTVDSAIFKGSTSIDRTIDPSGDRPSPLIRKLFADRDYIAADATVDSRRPLDLSSYRKLVFVVGPAPANRAILVKSGEVRAREWATTRKWLLSTFGVQPELFDCDFERANGNNGLLVACLRREETLAAPITMPVRYVASTADLSADGTVTLLSGEERALDPGEKLIAARTGELFRFDGGAYTRLVGDDVRRLQVEGVGAWDASASGVSGVTAILRDGAWTLDKIDVEPANPDPWFQVPAQRRALSNAWSIVPSEQSATVSRLRDSRSTYIRVRPRSELKRLQIKGAMPLPTLDGVPVTVQVDFRLNRPGAVVELIVGDGIGQVEPRWTSIGVPATGGWQRMVVRVPRVEFPSDRDHFMLSVGDVRDDDELDIRDIAVFLGVIPDPITVRP